MSSVVAIVVGVVKLIGGGTVLLARGAAPPMLATRLPMPTQKAMASPASSPTTAPCGGGEALSPLAAPDRVSVGGEKGIQGTHCGVGTGKEHPQAEEPQQRPSHHAEDTDGRLQGDGTVLGPRGENRH